MMPAFCPADAPPGEKSIYASLLENRETDDWIVLHSLGLADHIRQVEGEVDFVVIIPNVGVLVIEVKSHKSIDRRSDGTWKLGADAPTSRGPFQQAREAMHSLRSFLSKKHIDMNSVPMLSAVWFTSVRARTMLPSDPEWHDWQVMDSQDLRAAPKAIRRTISAGTAHLNNKIKYFTYGGVGLDPGKADRIAGLLRPKFELAQVAGDLRLARKTQLVSFMKEQFLALDTVSENRSVLFSGPAGSGKTFLAMESARREMAAGKIGRFLCFNRFLGKRLNVDMADLEGLTVGTFHGELLRIAGVTQPPDNPSSEFWNKELPERALESMIDGGNVSISDFLIVDEIQDIAIDQYLDVLDLMVVGGLKGGRVLLFGDFERQALYENAAGRERIIARAPYMSSHRLMHNCRNLPRIGYQVNILSRLDPGYRQFRRDDDGVDPVFHQYQAGQDQSPLLAAAIRGLKEEGYELSEIVILSPYSARSTAATTEDPWLRQILKPVNGSFARPGQTQFSSIHAFKGLEAPAIVVTDLDEGAAADNFDSVLYVGLTRATDRLIALIEKSTFRKILEGRA